MSGGKNDFGASHWSSDKVWDRRKKRNTFKLTTSDPAFWKQPVTITLNLVTLMAVHGNLCLALRHPLNQGESREMIVTAVKQIGKYLVELGALTPEQLKETERLEAEEGSPDLKG